MVGSTASAAPTTQTQPTVALNTNFGMIIVVLDQQRAPKTVANFLQYVTDGFYNGTVFHRVIPGFVAQAGGFTTDFDKKETRAPVANESGNGLSNTRGTIAMARTADPNSATSQFFINLADNTALDPQHNRWGYTVFGHVVDGMDIVDKIASLPTGPAGPFRADVPDTPVVIEKAEVVHAPQPENAQ